MATTIDDGCIGKRSHMIFYINIQIERIFSPNNNIFYIQNAINTVENSNFV